jgi:hypothetical protein
MVPPIFLAPFAVAFPLATRGAAVAGAAVVSGFRL